VGFSTRCGTETVDRREVRHDRESVDPYEHEAFLNLPELGACLRETAFG
jgi:hypothetical protein